MSSPTDDLDPARLESAKFELVRRGFDPAAVREELQRAAQEIRRLHVARDDLAGRLAEFDEVTPDQLEVHRVAEALGVEATQVIEAAHIAASERAERAEREAEAVRGAALAVAETTRNEAQTARDEIIAAAQREAEITSEEGREHGREMVAEAQAVRERMLRDLARKRQTGRAQVEQLRAGRDRLLDSLTITQQSLDAAVIDLVNSVPEARSAAERAGLRVTSEPTPTPDQLESEIESARLVGHPLIDDIADPGPIGDAFITSEMEALTDLDVLRAPEVEEVSEATEDSGLDVSEPVDDSDDAAESADETDGSADEVGEVSEVELYDVESEDDAVPEPEPEPVEADASDVFAKLRSQQDSEPDSDSDSEPEPDSEPAPEGLEVARVGARKRAAAAAAKAMKKVLVEEQGTLLDGVRRSGAEALSFVIEDGPAHRSAYEEAAADALRELVAELGGSKRIKLTSAFDQIDAIALEPVRQRLTEVAERGDDPEELSDTVRALYRESRSRRIGEAANAAAVAVDGHVAVALAKGSVTWHVEPGGPCGPDCADNALEGAVKSGKKFPTGAPHPPAHAACTCWLEPVE